MIYFQSVLNLSLYQLCTKWLHEVDDASVLINPASSLPNKPLTIKVPLSGTTFQMMSNIRTMTILVAHSNHWTRSKNLLKTLYLTQEAWKYLLFSAKSQIQRFTKNFSHPDLPYHKWPAHFYHILRNFWTILKYQSANLLLFALPHTLTESL